MNQTRYIRIALLIIFLVALGHQLPQVKEWESGVADALDRRPAVNVLFVGNSRTFMNDMPFMIPKIADSAHSKQKYEITMHAPGGAHLEDQWNNQEVQDLLRQKWDYVSLQGQSAEQVSTKGEESFQTYGKKLAELIKENGAVPVLYVTWRYSDDDPLYKQAPQFRDTLHNMIQKSYTELAQASGAQMVNVGEAWEKLHRAAPQMPLYIDTNHPSIYGSYLCALMFYRFFSHDDLNNVTYIPEGISATDADLIKSAAQAW